MCTAMGEKGILNSSQQGSVRHYARDGYIIIHYGTQLHGASGRIDLAGSQVHFNRSGPDRHGDRLVETRCLTQGKVECNSENATVAGRTSQ